MSYISRFFEIETALVAKMEIVAKTLAEEIETRAKDRVPVNTGDLRDAIHVERVAEGTVEIKYAVIAGDNKAFYGHIVEHGGANQPAHPFLVPAAEEVRAEIPEIGRAALRSL